MCHQCLCALGLGRRLMSQTQISSLPLLIINQNQPGPEKISCTPTEQPAGPLTLSRVHESQIISHPAGHMVPFKPLPGATKEVGVSREGLYFFARLTFS